MNMSEVLDEQLAETFTGHPIKISLHGGEVCKRCDEQDEAEAMIEAGDRVYATVIRASDADWRIIAVFHRHHDDVAETAPLVLEATAEKTGYVLDAAADPDALTLGGVRLRTE